MLGVVKEREKSQIQAKGYPVHRAGKAGVGTKHNRIMVSPSCLGQRLGGSVTCPWEWQGQQNEWYGAKASVAQKLSALGWNLAADFEA